MVLSATTTTTTMGFLFVIAIAGGMWRPETRDGFPLGAEAATKEIGWNGMRYTIDDDSTVQFDKDFSGTTKTIGPYYLSERAQHIKDEFTDPYNWADYLQDFESYMAEFCEVSGGDDWDTFTDYMFTPSDGGVQN